MPKQFQFYIAIVGILLVSLVVGNAVAEGDYFTPALMVCLILAIVAVILPGYGFFLALGVLCPFTLPLPFVYRFPFILLILGLCCARYVISRPISHASIGLRVATNWAVLLLFAWVIFRYCMNPVKPGLAIGSGNAVTGFRGYLNYAICFGIVLTLGLFIRTREDAVQLTRWLGYLALFFVLLFIPLTFSTSYKAYRVLADLGVAVGFFDSGRLRFISMPLLGLVLLTVAMLPNLCPLRPWQRGILLIVALAAIILGGNRAAAGMAMIIVLCIAFARRRARLFAVSVATIGVVLVSFYIIGETMSFNRGVGFLRVVALVSPRAAEKCDAAQTIAWRKARWERAIIDIKKEPWLGVGYGGLNSIFAYTSMEDLAQNLVEIDVAAGSIHNGFIAGTRAFGVPFIVLFLGIFLSRIYIHGRDARRQLAFSQVQGELNALAFAMLCAYPLAIYVGLDLNSHEFWFFIAFGFVISTFNEAASQELPAERPSTVAPPWRRALPA